MAGPRRRRWSAPRLKHPSAAPAALQACASDPTNDYIVANDGPTLKAALLTFLNAALKTPVRFSS